VNTEVMEYTYSGGEVLKLVSIWSDEFAEDMLNLYGIVITTFNKTAMQKRLLYMKEHRMTGDHQFLISIKYDEEVNLNIFTYTTEMENGFPNDY
jgi:hypothetical protein